MLIHAVRLHCTIILPICRPVSCLIAAKWIKKVKLAEETSAPFWLAFRFPSLT